MTAEVPGDAPADGADRAGTEPGGPSSIPDHARPALAPGPGAPVVVVVSAPWAGPSRPAPTVLRELGRRWGDAVRTLLVEDPTEELLDLWEVDALPTWLRFVPVENDEMVASGGPATLPELSGMTSSGEAVALPGPWVCTHRLTGAQPKHVIDAEFGPAR